MDSWMGIWHIHLNIGSWKNVPCGFSHTVYSPSEFLHFFLLTWIHLLFSLVSMATSQVSHWSQVWLMEQDKFFFNCEAFFQTQYVGQRCTQFRYAWRRMLVHGDWVVIGCALPAGSWQKYPIKKSILVCYGRASKLLEWPEARKLWHQESLPSEVLLRCYQTSIKPMHCYCSLHLSSISVESSIWVGARCSTVKSQYNEHKCKKKNWYTN